MQPETNGELSGEAWTWGKSWASGPVGRLARGATALRNRWLRDADAFVAMSRVIREEMRDAGVPGERIALLHHGVDTERFSPATAEEKLALRRELGLAEAGVVAVYTGRLLKGKGLETLLDAFAAVADRAAGLRLVLVGSGEGQALSVEDDLRRRVAAGGLGTRVAFAGRSERVEDYLRAADVFVFPSVFEALGIALVEAAACGLPALASRTGGIVDVVEDRVSGHLVPPGDAAALVACPARSRFGPPSSGEHGAGGARHRARALRRARRRRALPGPVPRGRRYAGLCRPAGTCSSCRCSSSSITGLSSLNEK